MSCNDADRMKLNRIAELIDEDVIASALRIARRAGIARPSGAIRVARQLNVGDMTPWATFSADAAIDFGLAALKAMHWCGDVSEGDAACFWAGLSQAAGAPMATLIEQSRKLALAVYGERRSFHPMERPAAACGEPALFAATMLVFGLQNKPVDVYVDATTLAIGDQATETAFAFDPAIDGEATIALFSRAFGVFPEAFSAPLSAQTLAEKARYALTARRDGFYGDNDAFVAHTIVYQSPAQSECVKYLRHPPLESGRIPALDIVQAAPHERMCVALASAANFLRNVLGEDPQNVIGPPADKDGNAALIFGYGGHVAIIRPIEIGARMMYWETRRLEEENEQRRFLHISDPLNQDELRIVVEALTSFIESRWRAFADDAKRQAERVMEAAKGRGMHLINVAYGFRRFVGKGETLAVAAQALRDAGVETPSAALRNDPFEGKKLRQHDLNVAEILRDDMNL